MLARETAKAPKRATNLSVDSELLRQAKAHGVNLSQTFETALRGAVREAEARAWRERNREAIEAANELANAAGLFSDHHRTL